MNNRENGTNHSRKDDVTAQQLRGKAFRVAFEMIAVFGLPAILALVVGGWLKGRGFPGWVTYALLGVAFVSSWLIVFVRVKQFARDLRKQSSEQDDEK